MYLGKTHAATWQDPGESVLSIGILARRARYEASLEIERIGEATEGRRGIVCILDTERSTCTYIIFELGAVTGWIIYVAVRGAS